MTRREAIERALADAERDLAYTTLWLSQCGDPAYPGAEANREHFLDWRWDANKRYTQALRLMVRLKPEPAAPVIPKQLDLL